MRNTILLLIFTLFAVTRTLAQISDADAKIQFQKITDTYDRTEYVPAARLCEDLKSKMGKWNPKLLYIYLQSVYKSYIDSRPGISKFDMTYQNLSLFKNLSDEFLGMVDRNTYPAEKYNDILVAKKYFEDNLSKTEYQTSRTIEKAVAFLNECAGKFTNPQVGSENLSISPDPTKYGLGFTWGIYNDKCAGAYLNFVLDNGLLHIKTLTKLESTESSKNNRILFMYDVIDLRHLPSIDSGSVSGNAEKVYAYIYHRIHFVRNMNIDVEDTMFRPPVLKDGKVSFKYYRDGKSYYTDKNTKSKIDREISEPNSIVYPILDLFDKNNKEYINGKYEERINEAWKYIIHYYPKEKRTAPPAKVEKRDNGF